MEDLRQPISAILEKAEDYAKNRAELLHLQAVKVSSDITSSLLAGFVIAFLINLCLILLSVGIAIWIGINTGKPFYGFFAAGGFYLVLCIVALLIRRKWLKQSFQNLLIKKLIR